MSEQKPSVTLNVRIHTDNMVPEQHNHRLAVIRYKATKEQPKPPANRAVSVPRVTIAVEPECLQAALLQAFEDMQDNLLRTLINARLARDPNVGNFLITEEDISATAVASYAAEQASSNRLSGDKLKSWFDASIRDALTLAIAKARGLDQKSPENVTSEDTDRLNKAVDSYRDVIAGFASPRASWNETTLSNVSKAIAFAPANDPTREALEKKITELRKPREQTLLESL